MSYRIAPAAQCLLDQATALWPNRSRASDGTIGDPAHAARASDHNPDSRGIVHAADLTHDPANGCDNNRNAEQVKDDPRVKYVIWNRRIWNPAISRTWRPYTGSNPHDHHMHVSVTDAGENDTSPWFTTTEGDDPMAALNDDQIEGLIAAVQEINGVGAAYGQPAVPSLRDKIENSQRRTRRLLRDVARKVGMTDAEIQAALDGDD